LRSALDKLKVEGDEQIGVNIVKRALVEPLRQIAENAGEEGAIVLGKVNDSKDNNYGFNALTSEYEDLVKGGRARSDEGSAHSTDQRRLDRGADADDRSAGGGDPGGEEERSDAGRPRRRRHGRHVLRRGIKERASKWRDS
jgi:hypothetical protein